MAGRKPAAAPETPQVDADAPQALPEPEPPAEGSLGWLAFNVDQSTGANREAFVQGLVQFQTPDPVNPDDPDDNRPVAPKVDYTPNGTVLEWPTLSKKTGKFLVRSIFYARQLPDTLYPGTQYERKVVALQRAIRGDVVVLDVDDATQSAVDAGYLEPFKE